MPKYFQFTSCPLPLSIETIGCEWNQEAIFRPQGFPSWHWLQTESGHGRIQLENQEIPLPKGCGILIKPDIPHSYFPDYNWITNFVTFGGSLSNEIETIVGTQAYLLASDSEHFSYAGWINKIVDEHIRETAEPLRLSTACYSFLLHIAQARTSGGHQQNPLYLKYVAPVITEIETNFATALTLDLLAAQVYVSPQYLTRLFRRFTGHSPYAYLQAVRINRAKELLVNQPELEVQHVGFRVGIPGTSHFIEIFRKATGYTPLKFRNLNQ